MAAEGGNEAMKEPPKVVLRCKLCMVGDAGVGKTALTEVYTKSKFPKSYTMTSEAAFTVSTVDVAGEDVGSKSNLRVELCIFDVPGQGICREASLELVRSGPAPHAVGGRCYCSLTRYAGPSARTRRRSAWCSTAAMSSRSRTARSGPTRSARAPAAITYAVRRLSPLRRGSFSL